MFKILHSDYFAETYPDEWAAMKDSFTAEQLITDTREFEQGDIILPRYRTVPFGNMLEMEAVSARARLINTFEQSSNIRDIYSWVDLLDDLTAPALTIDDLESYPEGKFFVKGQTSSLKNRGVSAVFANSKAEARELALGITVDPWLSGEKPVIRPLQDYLKLGVTPTGLPIFHERRVFVYRGNILAEGFYWSSFIDCLASPIPQLDGDFYDTVRVACNRVKTVGDFLVVDMAQYSDGRWGVVELNDGCQAGVSDNKDTDLYKGLAKFVK